MNIRQLLTQVAREKGMSNEWILKRHLHATDTTKPWKFDGGEESLETELTEEEKEKYRRFIEDTWDMRTKKERPHC